MAVQLAARLDLDREQVTDRPHLERRSRRDPGQHRTQVVHRDQVRRGGEHAPQPLLHRVQLMAERVGLLRGVGVVRRGIPAHVIDAASGAHRLAFPVLDRRRRQPEQHRRARHQPACPRAIVDAAREPVRRHGNHLGIAGAGLGHLEPGHRGELGRSVRDRSVHLLRHADRPQHGGHLRAAKPTGRVHADRPGELRVVGDPRAGPPQGHRLVVRDPVCDVEQVIDAAPAAGQAEHLMHRILAPERLDPREQHRAHRAREMIASIGPDGGRLRFHPVLIGVVRPCAAVVCTDWTNGC
jgi:hypothetical protein